MAVLQSQVRQRMASATPATRQMLQRFWDNTLILPDHEFHEWRSSQGAVDATNVLANTGYTRDGSMALVMPERTANSFTVLITLAHEFDHAVFHDGKAPTVLSRIRDALHFVPATVRAERSAYGRQWDFIHDLLRAGITREDLAHAIAHDAAIPAHLQPLLEILFQHTEIREARAANGSVSKNFVFNETTLLRDLQSRGLIGSGPDAIAQYDELVRTATAQWAKDLYVLLPIDSPGHRRQFIEAHVFSPHYINAIRREQRLTILMYLGIGSLFTAGNAAAAWASER